MIPGNRTKGSVGEGEPGKKAKETLRSLRPHELVRTSLRNQKVRHNISSVQSRTDGWRRKVLSSWSGDVTFLLTKMIRGILSLVYQVQNTWLPNSNFGIRKNYRQRGLVYQLVLIVGNSSWEEEYKIKTSEQLQSVIDKRNTRNEKNVQMQRDRTKRRQVHSFILTTGTVKRMESKEDGSLTSSSITQTWTSGSGF